MAVRRWIYKVKGGQSRVIGSRAEIEKIKGRKRKSVWEEREEREESCEDQAGSGLFTNYKKCLNEYKKWTDYILNCCDSQSIGIACDFFLQSCLSVQNFGTKQFILTVLARMQRKLLSWGGKRWLCDLSCGLTTRSNFILVHKKYEMLLARLLWNLQSTFILPIGQNHFELFSSMTSLYAKKFKYESMQQNELSK